MGRPGWAALGLWTALSVVPLAAELPSEFFAYLKRTEGEARWQVGDPRPVGSGELLNVRLHSQTWRGSLGNTRCWYVHLLRWQWRM